jgi:hypothetical protein
MPRGRPKMIGPLLPSGGYRSLMTKKRIAAKNAAWNAISSAVMSSGKRRGRPRKTAVVGMISTAATPVRRTRRGVSAFNSASAAGRAAMIADITGIARYKRRIGSSNKATPTQLASLAKARAARAAKKSGTTVAVAVAAPMEESTALPRRVGTGRGRPRTIGPNLPPGGYRTLISKKRLAAKAANFYSGPQMAYGEYF